MIQWGWAYAYYVHTGMTWGTRTGGSHEILEPFFPDKTIFVADLRRKPGERTGAGLSRNHDGRG